MIIYVGPNQILPLGTFLGTFLGVLLTFWSKVVAVVSRITRRPITNRKPEQSPAKFGPAARDEAPRDYPHGISARGGRENRL